MKKRIRNCFRSITAVLLSAVMIFCCADISAVAGSYFSGCIVADEPDIPLEGISIDIYGSKLKYSANGLKRYEHYYSGTVRTDRYGNFSFLRPSTKTLLKVDLGTLPYGTGVDEKTRLVSSRCDDTFTLSYVNDIKIVKSGDGSVFRADLTAADGSLLFADQNITDTVTSDSTYITYETLNSVRLDRTVTVSAAGLRRSRTFELDISDCTVTGKLSQLLDYGIIDESTKEKITEDYKEETATPEDLRPVFYNERTFVAGNFMMHSEQETKNISQYENDLRDIVDVYFRKYGFIEPYHEYVSEGSSAREKYYHIYLVDPDILRVDSAVAPKNVVGKTMSIDIEDVTKGSYIVVSSDEALRFKWTLSHEIFHTIEFRYMGKRPTTWFNEAFADYGSMLCINGSLNALTKHIANYLNSPGYSLNNSSMYKNRQYGICLMPLYIHNQLGGVQTIKNILKAYANSTSAYKAIDKGLKATKSSYGFASMFAGFKDMNSYTEFYKIRDLSAAKSTAVIKKRGERTENVSFDDTDTAATPQMTLTGNSAAYFEFTAPSSSKGKLTVTVETTGGAAADASYNLVLKGKKITIPGRGKTAELMTFVLTDFGGGFSTAVLTAGNISMSSKNTISFDATAFFEEN